MSYTHPPPPAYPRQNSHPTLLNHVLKLAFVPGLLIQPESCVISVCLSVFLNHWLGLICILGKVTTSEVFLLTLPDSLGGCFHMLEHAAGPTR